MQNPMNNQNPVKYLYDVAYDVAFLNETWHIQNPNIFRTLGYFETMAYSEPCQPCQTYTMKYFIQNH